MASVSSYAVVAVEQRLFAVSVEHVREMIVMPKIGAVPGVGDHIRGVLTLRGDVMPVVDVRTRIGCKSALQDVEEFTELLNRREQDHVNWLAELQASVRECREFKLTLDPHACAFGRWYDTYETDDILISEALKKFDAPHKRIHALGAHVHELMAHGDYEGAHRIVVNARNTTLAELRRLFSDFRNTIRNQLREIAIIITSGERTFAAAVDSVVSIEKIASERIEKLPAGMPLTVSGLVTRTARRGKTDELLLVLEAHRLLDRAATAA